MFYNILIPPIVFYAGFSIKKKLFFKNLVTIAIFGILGCNLTGRMLHVASSFAFVLVPLSVHQNPTVLSYPCFLPVRDERASHCAAPSLTVAHLQPVFSQRASTPYSRHSMYSPSTLDLLFRHLHCCSSLCPFTRSTRLEPPARCSHRQSQTSSPPSLHHRSPSPLRT